MSPFAVRAGRLDRASAPSLWPALRSPAGGRPLPAGMRADMEHALGSDFSDVRVHHGPEAGALEAEAATVGNHIFFPPGFLDTSSRPGRERLAHELVHVRQQREGRLPADGDGLAIDPDPRLEQEAEALAGRATAGGLTAAEPGAEILPGTDVATPAVQRARKKGRGGTKKGEAKGAGKGRRKKKEEKEKEKEKETKSPRRKRKHGEETEEQQSSDVASRTKRRRKGSLTKASAAPVTKEAEKEKEEEEEEPAEPLIEGTPVSFTIISGGFSYHLRGTVLQYDGETEKYLVEPDSNSKSLVYSQGDIWVGKDQVQEDQERSAEDGNQGKRYQRSTAKDPTPAEILELGPELSGLTPLLLTNPLSSSHLLLAGGIHGLSTFQDVATARGLTLELPGSAREGSASTRKKKRSTAISATNSFSSLASETQVSGERVAFGFHRKTGGTPLAESGLAAQQAKALTSHFDAFVHQQIKAPQRGRDKKLEALGINPPENKQRLKFHTEAKWYNSKEFRRLTDGVIARMKHLLLKLLPPALSETQDPWQAWRKEYGDGAGVPDEVLAATLGPDIREVITVLINRSSCTSCSGYCGGCAQEGADTVRTFWAKVAEEMGAPLAGLLEATSAIQFRTSVAARDTNAGSKTVSVPLEHGLDVQVHLKYDFYGNAPQPIDRNQFDFLKLIRDEKAALTQKSPAVFDESRPGAGAFKEYKAGMQGLKQQARKLLEAVYGASPTTIAAADETLKAAYEGVLAVLRQAVDLTFAKSPVPGELTFREEGEPGPSKESYLESFKATYEEALGRQLTLDNLASTKLQMGVLDLSLHFNQVVDEMVYEWELDFLTFPAIGEEEKRAL